MINFCCANYTYYELKWIPLWSHCYVTCGFAVFEMQFSIHVVY